MIIISKDNLDKIVPDDLRKGASKEKYSNKPIRIIHTILKNFVINTGRMIFKAIPKEYRIDCYEKVPNDTLRFQWKVFDKAYTQWKTDTFYEKKENKYGEVPPIIMPEAVKVLRNSYFTILSYDTRWLRFTKTIRKTYDEMNKDE